MSSRDETQEKAFLRWINIVLSKHPATEGKVENLVDAIKDGITLGRLAEVVIPSKLRLKQSVRNDLERTQHVTLALDAFTNSGLKLINIHSSAIVRGDKKTILGLMFQLCIRYQVVGNQQDDRSPNGEQQKQLTVLELKNNLIKWINDQLLLLRAEHNSAIRVIAGFSIYSEEPLECRDLENSLKNGAVLMGLIAVLSGSLALKSIQAMQEEIDDVTSTPERTLDWLHNINPDFDYSRLTEEQRLNVVVLTVAMRFASATLQIPQLIDAEDMVLNADGNASLAYYSYFKNYVRDNDVELIIPFLRSASFKNSLLSADLVSNNSTVMPELPPNVVTLETFNPAQEYDDDVVFYL